MELPVFGFYGFLYVFVGALAQRPSSGFAESANSEGRLTLLFRAMDRFMATTMNGSTWTGVLQKCAQVAGQGTLATSEDLGRGSS